MDSLVSKKEIKVGGGGVAN